MQRFLYGVLACGLFVVMLAMIAVSASNNSGNSAVLSTVEYGIDTQAALEDRAAERAHNEEMARIEAARAQVELEWRTYRIYGIAAIVAVSLFAVAWIYGTARRPRIVYRLPEHDVMIVDPEHKRLEVRR